MSHFIPMYIQCFWCNGKMERGTTFSGPTLNHVTYFCKDCGAVSHFAMNYEKRISSIEVEYKSDQKEPERTGGTVYELRRRD